MKFFSKRIGASALATTLIATVFGTAGSGAVAQDQAEPIVLETDQTLADTAEAPAEPEIRFVMSEVVQELPEEPEIEIPAPASATNLRELVSTTDTSGEMSRDMMCLAQAVYFEARGEPLDGQLAVARVVINRAESSRFPDDYCSVVTQRAQFSFVRGGNIPAPNHGSAAWTRAKAVARIAHRDLWDSPAHDALYFHATHIRPRWAGRLQARATIDNHVFYR
ncbi:cell wall hydrolase [Aurantiacibacter poecillastricola]|uniref:cell wall hydrolase n=1 Tax=Aurantiacibacter poecillastricola TaxID=3064385 RepID=UPI00273DDA35|nr:cell wall hydrolase [Aurantiacibacter sp. 219JJ12-13]MDP5260516.1 cell wall hydrolase [Aurantiacibacter sp. 219JJ12-13]